MWQYTETGRVSGIDRVCDKNYCYYDYPSYIKANGLNGFSKPSVANPQFSFKTGANLSLNEASKRIYLRKEPGLTQAQFISKYVSYKDVTVKMTALTSAGTVKTGSTVSAEGNGKSFGPYTVCLIGDINADSKINSADALLVLQHVVGITTLSKDAFNRGDMDSNGKVNSYDALQILYKAVGA